MNLPLLKAELNDDPLTRGYASMSAAQAAQSLHTSDVAIVTPLSSADLLAWVAQAGRFDRLDAACDHSDAQVRSLAGAAMLLIERSDTALDLADASRLAMLDALVVASVFTSQEKAELLALASATTTRAAQLGLGRVMPHHVLKARSQ